MFIWAIFNDLQKSIELFYLTDIAQFIAYPITNKDPLFTGLCRFINFMVVQSNIFMENTLFFNALNKLFQIEVFYSKLSTFYTIYSNLHRCTNYLPDTVSFSELSQSLPCVTMPHFLTVSI